jgi:hypothetical protein
MTSKHFDGEHPKPMQCILHFELAEEATMAYKWWGELSPFNLVVWQVHARHQHHQGAGHWPSARAITAKVKQEGSVLLGEGITPTEEVLVLLPTGVAIDGTHSVQLMWEGQSKATEPHQLWDMLPSLQQTITFTLHGEISLVLILAT